ncbi:MAG: 30S ribosomal protein S18 [Candidatus Omnitrophota bacterium]
MFKKKEKRPMRKSDPRALGKTRTVRLRMSSDEKIDYKNPALLQRFLTDRGKIVPHRYTGITTKQQRQLARSIKYARFLGLLATAGQM